MWRDQIKVASAEPAQQVVERPSDVVRSVWTSRCHPSALSLVSTITDHIRLLCPSAQIVEPRCCRDRVWRRFCYDRWASFSVPAADQQHRLPLLEGSASQRPATGRLSSPQGFIAVNTSRRDGAPKMGGRGNALDHENRNIPISKPAANAQRPNVQAETTRTRLRRSCGFSWDWFVIAAASPAVAILAILSRWEPPEEAPPALPGLVAMAGAVLMDGPAFPPMDSS